MSKVLVVGAGPVGAAFALLAARHGMVCELVDARNGPATESRTLALSHGSREILERAGAWSAALPATPILTIHTSQQGHFGRALLCAADAEVPALGYVVSYAALQAALDAALLRAGLCVHFGARVEQIEQDADAVQLEFSVGGATRRLSADALVLADGGANLARVPELVSSEKDYGQVALLAHLVGDQPHGQRAFERFTAEGPAALLPMGQGGEWSMVWVSGPARIDELKALPDAQFLEQFQRHFGNRAGMFRSVASRRAFPLKLRQVAPRAKGRIAVIGNAAQALHPVAGQGFNLGLRDARELSARLAGHRAADALAAFAQARARDVTMSIAFTDFLVGAFSNDLRPLGLARGAALSALDALPWARRLLARRMVFGGAR
ncbi:MAG TPA: FAD-dependent monooxygenase [Usitatibacteraceae bacterium]|nr:FAD-dependent monooxygenase [Usitatibacteraceae bacterium]